jgi:hypothetical protein
MTNEAFARVKIDALLAAQGWNTQDPNAVCYEVVLPDSTRADYVLCDRHGRSLAVIEAKRFSVSPCDAAAQAKAYAQHLGVPYVFLANGDEVRFWDWQREAFPRVVKTFFKQDDLERRPALELESVARLVTKPTVAHRCRSLAAAMWSRGVAGQPPTRAQMSANRFGRHDADDQFMVAAAELAYDLALPTESAGSNVLAMPGREEAWVRRLFERAVGGLYAVALSPSFWNVLCFSLLQWQISSKTDGIYDILPAMRTDVVLDHGGSGRRVVIDPKFTTIVTAGWYREQSLRSGYIYQMYAYLRSQVGCGDLLADSASGLLLHPSAGSMVDETVVIQGQPLRFATVDLAAKPAEIRAQLLKCVEVQC